MLSAAVWFVHKSKGENKPTWLEVLAIGFSNISRQPSAGQLGQK